MARSRSFALDTPFHRDARRRAASAPGLRLGTSVIALALALPMALAGCDSGTQEPDAPAPEAVEYTAPTGSETAERAPSDGSRAAMPSGPVEIPEGFKAEIPANFPSNVPLPPGAKPVLGRGANVDGSERTGVQLASSQSPAEVLSYYEDEFAAGGWTMDGSADNNAITATNGDKTVVLFVTPDPSGGSVVYMVTETGVTKQ